MRQRLGQHFLKDAALARRIVRALRVHPSDSVVEIGPGRGALTSHLVGRCARLILVERDAVLARGLRERFGRDPTVQVVEDDAVRMNLPSLILRGGEGDTEPVLVIGNLPYESSTAILSNLLRQRLPILRMVLMFQYEVAQRIAAPPGHREHGALSVLVQVRCLVEPLMEVAPNRFLPPPSVRSQVLRLTPHPPDHPFAVVATSPSFEDLVRALHSHPRKTVLNSLSSGMGIPRARVSALLEQVGVAPTMRPCQVPLDRVVALWGCFTHGEPSLSPTDRPGG